jgi:hypothetical protein
MRSADVEDDDLLVLAELDHLRSVGRGELTRAARRFAARVRLEPVRVTVGEDNLSRESMRGT